MKNCDCRERLGIEINSWKQYEEMKLFFEGQIKKGIFIEVPVERPYYIGCGANDKRIKWYADKWYECVGCNTLWEFTYPDFPAQGFVRKFNKNNYMEIE